MKKFKSTYIISKIDESDLTDIEAEEMDLEISKVIGSFRCWSVSSHLKINNI